MELNIYKGFDNSVLSKLKEAPVLDLPYENRKDVIHFDRQLIKKLRLLQNTQTQISQMQKREVQSL